MVMLLMLDGGFAPCGATNDVAVGMSHGCGEQAGRDERR